MLVLSSIAQDQAHARCIFALRALELAAGHGFAQLKNVVGRLSEVDVDRVNLLDDSQRSCLALTYQRTFCHQSPTDSA